MDEKSLQKEMVARAAVQWLADYVRQRNADTSLLLGVGSGSTVAAFIAALAEQPVLISGLVPASEEVADLVVDRGFRLVNLDEVSELELYIDGADWIDPWLRTLKGGGAALVREKVLATAADFFLCLCDASKTTESLQGHTLPFEVLYSARSAVCHRLSEMGGEPRERAGTVTDSGNLIVDVDGLNFAEPLEAMEERLASIPGVVDCGLFARRRADLLLLAQDSAAGDSEVVRVAARTFGYS